MGGRRCSILSLDELVDAFRFLPKVVVGDVVGVSTLQKATAAEKQLRCVGRIRDRLKAGLSVSICESVGGCWLSECSNPRDKIYAMLGMLSESQVSEVRVDYSMSWQILYERVASCLIRWGEGFEMLQFAGIDTTAAGSPSWVPNWNPPMTAPQRHIAPLGQRRHYYCAGGRSRAEIRLSQDSLVFKALGTFFDEVSWISRTAQCVSGDDYAQWEASVKMEVLARFTRHRNGESITEAYQRTLVADVGPDGEAIGRDDLLQAYDAFHDQSWRNHDSRRRYYHLHEARYRKFLQCSVAGIAGRKLCVTARGYFGLVPSNSKLQDSIVVFSGNNLPLVLRERDGKYLLVGQCYIHGIMKGEALERSGTHLDWISIH